MMLTTNLTRSEDSYAAAQRRARIVAAQSADAARCARSEPRDSGPSIGDEWAGSLERERRQEVAAMRARIGRAVARYSETNMTAMRVESSMIRPKPKPPVKAVAKGSRRRV